MNSLLKALRGRGDLGWRDIGWLSRAARVEIVAVAVLSVLGALTEAAALVLLLRMALSMSSDSAQVDAIPMLGWTPSTLGLLLLIIGMCLVRLLLAMVSSWLAAGAVARRLRQIRGEVHEAYLRSDWLTQFAQGQGEVQDLVSTQSSKGVSVLTALFVGLGALLNFTTFTISAMLVTPLAAWFIVIGVGGLFLILRPVSALASRVAGAQSAAGKSYGHAISDSVRLHQEISSFGVPVAEAARVGHWARAIAVQHRRSVFIARTLPAVYQSVAISLLAVGLFAVGRSSSLTAETIGSTLVLLLRAFSHSQKLQSVYNDLSDRTPYLRRVRRDLELFRSAERRYGNIELEKVDHLEINGVGFDYAGKPALAGVSFRAELGQVVGIVGPSGAGKSTLLRVLAGLVVPERGTYLMNGQSASAFSAESFSRRVAVVPQEPRILDGTVIDNVQFMRNISFNEAVDAIGRANLRHDIERFENGFETQIGERGRSLSGGQKQRLSFARALANRPDLLLLDEPTSALDQFSEDQIHKTIESLRGDLITVIITHRQSTIDMCDVVVEIGGEA